MHFIFIVIGAFIGAWLGDVGDEVLGTLAGILIASLLFRLSRAASRIDQLQEQVDRLWQRDISAMPRAAQESTASRPVSLYEPEPAEPEDSPAAASTTATTAATPTPASDLTRAKFVPRPAEQPETVVHERKPETSPAASPLSHTVDVAKRWLTTGNVPVKVGIVLSFFGVAFLLKYAVENSVLEIPISVRYLGVAAFAAVLLGIGWRMRGKQKVYALSLQGGGIGVLFLTVFAAFNIHGLLSPSLAFGILILVTVAAGMLAIKQESRALAILGTTGGFLAPLLVSTGSGNHVALFSYYLLLNCAVLGVAWHRAWRELNIIGFVFTFGVGTLWGFQYYVPEKFATTEPFLVLHFLFYTAIAVLFAFRQRPQLRGYVDGSLVFGTPTIAFALQTQLLGDSEYGLAYSAVAVAAFYALIALWLKRTQEKNFDLLSQSFVALSVAFATIAVPLALDDRWTAIAWALEGCALVWIGVRQSGTMARVTGAILAFVSGVIFVNYGWDDGLGIAVLNGNYLGAALIAAASLVSARLFASRTDEFEWHRAFSVALLAWGLVWWFGAGFAESFDRVSGGEAFHVFFLFFNVSFAAIAWFARRDHWTALSRSTLLMLPLLAPFAVYYLAEKDHFFDGLGAVAWATAIPLHAWILYTFAGEKSRAEMLWHTAGVVFFVPLLAYELFWQLDRVVLNDVWSASAALLVLAAAVFFLLRNRAASYWPFKPHSDAYYLGALALAAGYLLLLVLACIDEPGNPSPLPYIPVLNPFDVLSLLALGLLWMMKSDSSERWPLALWGGSAFVLATLALLRAVHHWAGVGWSADAMMNSVTAQTSLTIFWAALGLGGMLLGARRENRSIWMLGVGLMVIVVAKMAVVDLGSTGTVQRIVSFLGVGIMLLIVGYFAPVPPRGEEGEENTVAD
ncbi:MAG: DUF2339 domain-containing protein [Gammaproteobacteria bacterium]|nr:DUF2339 domain-containing protein [Gammaproteobacteria bacterium]